MSCYRVGWESGKDGAVELISQLCLQYKCYCSLTESKVLWRSGLTQAFQIFLGFPFLCPDFSRLGGSELARALQVT